MQSSGIVYLDCLMSQTIALVHFMRIGQDQVEIIFYIMAILEN